MYHNIFKYIYILYKYTYISLIYTYLFVYLYIHIHTRHTQTLYKHIYFEINQNNLLFNLTYVKENR